jgi:hypothetical protein
MLKNKGIDPERAIFTQTGSVSNTVTSLGQRAVSAAIVVMEQKGFRQMVVSEAKLKGDQKCHSGDARSERFLPQRKITGGE